MTLGRLVSAKTAVKHISMHKFCWASRKGFKLRSQHLPFNPTNGNAWAWDTMFDSSFVLEIK